MKPSLLIAAGCSWVAGRALDTDPTQSKYDYTHVEDPEFIKQHSFAGQLQRRLGLDQIHFVAQNGTSNDQQVRAIINFIETNYDQYSSIFVLWGITTVYRWEMFSSTSNEIEAVQHNHVRRKPELDPEAKEYFSKHWNREYELEKLGNKVVMLNGYLKNLDIDCLFFNSFQSYNNEDLNIRITDNLDFYRVQEKPNDMLSLLCTKNNIKLSSSSVPFLNMFRPNTDQFNNSSVRELQRTGWLDQATAHPTVQAHELIANELYDYLSRERK